MLPETKDPYEITDRYGEEFATRADYIEKYRNAYAFHPVHAILATHPLKRLRHAARVFCAGALDPKVPRHLGWEVAASVEEAVARAQAHPRAGRHHRRGRAAADAGGPGSGRAVGDEPSMEPGRRR